MVKHSLQSSPVVASPVRRSDQTSTPYYPEIIRVLKQVFNLNSFRTNQLEAINATMDGKDVFVLMPTGGGKSLCYQVPAVCRTGKTGGITIVVSPLKSLMADQVNHLRKLGIDVEFLNSDRGDGDARAARGRLLGSDKPRLLYVTPEKLDKSPDFQRILQQLYDSKELARFVVDEAHCISGWGRDFRESYQSLNRLRRDYPDTPIMALTATADGRAIEDIITQLGIKGCVQLTQSFNRLNLHYEVRPKKPKSIIDDMANWIMANHRGECGVIYCLARARCEEVAKGLRDNHGLRAQHYHAHLDRDQKAETQAAWQRGECDIIVATIAFGMGIDKANVRFVIHHTLPMSLSNYYQETGRAGRDGKPADCLMFYTYADTNGLFKLIEGEDRDGRKPTREQIERQREDIRRVVQYCQNQTDCRRVLVLGYFGELFDRDNCNKRCDNCLGAGDSDVELRDMSASAIEMIELVKSILDTSSKPLPHGRCIDVFRGSKAQPIRDLGYDRLPMAGRGEGMDRTQVERLLDHLLAEGGIAVAQHKNAGGWANPGLAVSTDACATTTHIY
ncbi:hypothetical protein BOTBODRAFT_112984 [Botryobasidium botryosum FD-172 SS1]|uniref:ATP-dependent DNA helicase n=1 Tax=Botryobasidium botryosum (strain FD-172 SS1) TaxID=930990 RepID=A0A067MCE2_BOTB1|nr:hypothetical protein BOTBODRAFT_112984 [Botryobasidium botryosum FD-172 SS1]